MLGCTRRFPCNFAIYVDARLTKLGRRIELRPSEQLNPSHFSSKRERWMHAKEHIDTLLAQGQEHYQGMFIAQPSFLACCTYGESAKSAEPRTSTAKTRVAKPAICLGPIFPKQPGARTIEGPCCPISLVESSVFGGSGATGADSCAHVVINRYTDARTFST